MRNANRLFLSVSLAGFLASAAWLNLRTVNAAPADDAKPAAKIEPWKPEDIIYAETAQQARISPDAQWLVWVKSTGDKDKDARVSNLILSNLTENKEIPLTRGSDSNGQAEWSPDGQLLAFTSNRARFGAKPDTAPVQIWLINPHGGEPWTLTELARAPQRIAWLDKDTLIFSAEEDPALYEQELKRKKDDSEVVDDADHAAPVRLYKVSVKDKKDHASHHQHRLDRNWAASKDGKYVAAVHEKSLHYTFDQKVPPVAILHNLGDGTEKADIHRRARTPRTDSSLGAGQFRFLCLGTVLHRSEILDCHASSNFISTTSPREERASAAGLGKWIGSGAAATRDGFIAGLAAGAHYETSRFTRTKPGTGGRGNALRSRASNRKISPTSK